MLGKLFGGDTIKAVGNVIDDMHFSGEEKEKLKNGLDNSYLREVGIESDFPKWLELVD